MNQLAPIVLFTYNRLWHTQMTVDALKRNSFASKSVLFIFSDGARLEKLGDTQKVIELRRYLKTISGFKSVHVIERHENFGLAKSIISGVSEMIDQYGSAIVLEDDLVTSPYFLNYMNDGLNCYKEEERVISIHGYVYPCQENLPDVFFIRGADCWGWATWKRGWDLFEKSGESLYSKIIDRSLEKEFEFNHSYPYLQMLRDQIEGKNSSWAIRWYASAFLENKLTLYPGRSFVNNIGFDQSGTHCSFTDSYTVDLADGPVNVVLNLIEENSISRDAFECFFRKSALKLADSTTRKKNIFHLIYQFIKKNYKFPSS